MLTPSFFRSVASPVALVTGMWIAWFPDRVEAIPSCPPGASVITTNQTIVAVHGSDVKCVAAGVFVSEDVQAYTSSTVYSSADVGVDIEAYSTATIHVLDGNVGANIDSYGDSTINIYDVELAGHTVSYTNSTVNLFGGSIGGKLILYHQSRINVFAASLSSHDFGEIADLTGTLVGTFADGAAFSIDFLQTGPDTTLSLIAIPEPDTFALLTFAIGCLGAVRRRMLQRSSNPEYPFAALSLQNARYSCTPM